MQEETGKEGGGPTLQGWTARQRGLTLGAVESEILYLDLLRCMAGF